MKRFLSGLFDAFQLGTSAGKIEINITGVFGHFFFTIKMALFLFVGFKSTDAHRGERTLTANGLKPRDLGYSWRGTHKEYQYKPKHPPPQKKL